MKQGKPSFFVLLSSYLRQSHPCREIISARVHTCVLGGIQPSVIYAIGGSLAGLSDDGYTHARVREALPSVDATRSARSALSDAIEFPEMDFEGNCIWAADRGRFLI